VKILCYLSFPRFSFRFSPFALTSSLFAPSASPLNDTTRRLLSCHKSHVTCHFFVTPLPLSAPKLIDLNVSWTIWV